MTAVIAATVTVIERQYKTYFAITVNDILADETRSARSYINAEEVMGMFSVWKKKAPNAIICFIASNMVVIKNQTVNYLKLSGRNCLTDDNRAPGNYHQVCDQAWM